MSVHIHDPLFAPYDLRSYFEVRRQKLVEEVQHAPEGHVLQADPEAWQEGLVEKYRLDCPELDIENLYQDEAQDAEVDVSYISDIDLEFTSPFRHGYRIRIHLPFTGDGDLFQCSPPTFSTGGRPRGSVRGQELIQHIEYPDMRPIDIGAAARSWAQEVQKNLTWVCNDVAAFNEDLPSHARTVIVNRREAVQKHREHLAATALPTRPKNGGGGGATYVADAIERRPAPPLPAMELDRPLPLEPTLADEAYEDIVRTLHDTGISMASAHGTYGGMEEEDLRQVLLLPLNGLFRNKAMAEAFNGDGKADILLRWEDRNLFIGECKWWSGESGLSDALDQLLRYQAWRDTKLALILFVGTKNMTAVIEKSRAALAGHDRFVDWEASEQEDMLRAVINRTDDEKRLARLAVIFVHLPETD